MVGGGGRDIVRADGDAEGRSKVVTIRAAII